MKMNFRILCEGEIVQFRNGKVAALITIEDPLKLEIERRITNRQEIYRFRQRFLERMYFRWC